MNKYEAKYRWIATELKLQEKFDKNNQMCILYSRGSIYTCSLGINIGHEKSKLLARPCLVVSTDEINSRSTNVVVVPLSTDIKYKKKSKSLAYPWHYVLRKKNYPDLEADSAVQCEDIRCVSKVRFGEFVAKVADADMLEIDKRIKRTLALY